MTRIDAILAAIDARRELTKTEALELADAYREACKLLAEERARGLEVAALIREMVGVPLPGSRKAASLVARARAWLEGET